MHECVRKRDHVGQTEKTVIPKRIFLLTKVYKVPGETMSSGFSDWPVLDIVLDSISVGSNAADTVRVVLVIDVFKESPLDVTD